MTYSPKITAKKMGWQLGFVVISAAITAAVNFLQALPAEQNGTVFSVLLIALVGIQNALKHRND